jgi:hypothetical protein
MHKSEVLEELREDVRTEARAEGRAEQAHFMLLTIGRQHFGRAASRRQQEQLSAITDLERLDRMSKRLLMTSSWSDLLATP